MAQNFGQFCHTIKIDQEPLHFLSFASLCDDHLLRPLVAIHRGRTYLYLRCSRTNILGIFGKLQYLVNLVASQYLFEICAIFDVWYLMLDMPLLLRPLHPAAVHEAGPGEAEGGVQEENDHRNIPCRLAGECLNQTFWSISTVMILDSQASYDFRYFFTDHGKLCAFLFNFVLHFVWFCLVFNNNFCFTDSLCTSEPVHLFIQLLSRNFN